jgi:site-specific recombinase XerD
MLLTATNNNSFTLGSGLDDFKAVYMPARNYSNRTREEYESDIADLTRFLITHGIKSWLVVGLRDLQAYLAELDRRGLQPSSRNRKTYSIKTFFAFLHQTGFVRKDVSRELIPPAIPRKERRFLREEEYQAILAEAHSSRDRAILEVFLQTGLRLSELVHLTLSDLELPKRITKDPQNVGFLKVTRKRGKEAVLPLNWKAGEALSAWLRERAEIAKRGETTDALFISKFRRGMTPRSVRYLVDKYLTRAGIAGACVHTLRHTMATHYLAKGGDLKSVQEMLGHESLETTQIYLGLAKKVQRRMVQELAL